MTAPTIIRLTWQSFKPVARGFALMRKVLFSDFNNIT